MGAQAGLPVTGDARLDTLDSILSMVRRHNLRADSVSVFAEGISVGGLTPLPATPEETAFESSDLKIRQERTAEDKRLLGLG